MNQDQKTGELKATQVTDFRRFIVTQKDAKGNEIPKKDKEGNILKGFNAWLRVEGHSLPLKWTGWTTAEWSEEKTIKALKLFGLRTNNLDEAEKNTKDCFKKIDLEVLVVKVGKKVDKKDSSGNVIGKETKLFYEIEGPVSLLSAFVPKPISEENKKHFSSFSAKFAKALAEADGGTSDESLGLPDEEPQV